MNVHMLGISKRFGPSLAVDDVEFEARRGEVTALLGENGAGKSTLMKILYGIHRADAGVIRLNGQEVSITSPRQAIAHGIGMVFQQFSMIPALSVRENLALVLPGARRAAVMDRGPGEATGGAGPISKWWIGRDARRLEQLAAHLQRVVPDVDPAVRVGDLSVGQMQRVELAKVLLLRARCVILDEPSAVLTPVEAQRLWSMIRELTGQGMSVVLITHKLNDVRACADRVTVMRAGRCVGDAVNRSLDDADIVRRMVGHAPAPPRAREPLNASAATRLVIKDLTVGALHRVSLSIRAGEVVGVAGISGSGQTELAEAVCGLAPIAAGELWLDGRPQHDDRARRGPSVGVGYIPEQPLANAVAPDLSLTVNLALKHLRNLPFVPDTTRMAQQARALIQRFDVRPADPHQQARWLSGGNLQKLVAARELSGSPAVVVACYPTMGLDINASAQLYEVLFDLSRQGCAVLWISEDLDDLLRFAHRIAVMVNGRLVQVLDANDTSSAQIGALMSGADSGDPSIQRETEVAT